MTGFDLSCSMVETPRLAMNVWTSGPEGGRPVLLVHGNLVSGGFWQYVAQLLPDDVRVIAPEPARLRPHRGQGDRRHPRPR